MKRLKRLLIPAGALLAALSIGTGIAVAATDSAISGTTDHTIYKVARNLTVTGTVNGDIICAGETINIDATVNGDVICAGQTVTVNGTVHGNIRVAGQTVNVGAKIDHNATVAAQDATLQANAKVGQDAGIAAQTAMVESVVGRDLRGSSNSLTINSEIGRNADVNANRLELQKDAKITKTLNYTGPNELKKSDGATVGEVYFHKTEKKNHNFSLRGAMLAWHVYLLLALLVFSMVLVAAFPQVFVRLNGLATKNLGTVFLTGFLATIIVPIVVLALVASIIGVPLAIALLLSWFVVLMFSAPVSAFYVGSLILSSDRRVPLLMLVGSVVLGIVSLIPLIGWLVTLFAIWFGVGTLLLSSKRAYKKPNYTV